jgi:hypothetical protein
MATQMEPGGCAATKTDFAYCEIRPFLESARH